MNIPRKSSSVFAEAAFSLIEMVAVIAILATLMTAGISILNSTGNQSRRIGVDMLSGMIEQARTTAITTRSYVVLAIAEPGDLPASDERCRIGLFKVSEEDWPEIAASTVSLDKATLLSRWKTLNTGIVLLGGEVDGVPNPMDEPKMSIRYRDDLNIEVHAIAFNSRGGLLHPAGSSPAVIRIAEGGYRNGKAVPNMRNGQKAVTESLLKVGRVTARPYRIDG